MRMHRTVAAALATAAAVLALGPAPAAHADDDRLKPYLTAAEVMLDAGLVPRKCVHLYGNKRELLKCTAVDLRQKAEHPVKGDPGLVPKPWQDGVKGDAPVWVIGF